MAMYNAVSGQAPLGATVGDVIRTAGGNFTIVPPGTPGAGYNPKSGHWSIDTAKMDVPSSVFSSGKALVDTASDRMREAAEMANKVSQMSSAQQYEFNREEAQKQRDWQESMSNTAYQRQVADLKSAGLNPVLAVTQGQGATTPSGASASGGSYQGSMADVDTSASQMYSSIFSSILHAETQTDVARIQAETALETAGITSAAMIYGSDMAYNLGIDTRNPMWQVLNSLFSGNAGKIIDNLSVSKDDIVDRLKMVLPSMPKIGKIPNPIDAIKGLYNLKKNKK